jgi:cyanophycinase
LTSSLYLSNVGSSWAAPPEVEFWAEAVEPPVSALLPLPSAPLRFTQWAPEPVEGSLVICGGGVLPESIYQHFIELAGGPEARLVIIPTASLYAGTPDMEPKIDLWRARKVAGQVASVEVLHTRSREEANSEEFSQRLEGATGVWFSGGNQNWITSVYAQTRTEQKLRDLLDRGGAIGGTSAGAAIMSEVMITGGKIHPLLGEGLGFLNGVVVDQHFLKRHREVRLKTALTLRPGHVGVGVDEGTALVVRGRRFEVVGDSEVVLYLPESKQKPLKETRISQGQSADYVTLCRSALERAAEEHPVATAAANPVVAETRVPQGTLVIVGGGATPRAAITRFIEAAGGPEAPMVVVSNALGEEAPPSGEVVSWLQKAGARHVSQLHTMTRAEAHDPEKTKLLSQAKGIWFTGGRQWRLVDLYLDTPMLAHFQGVLSRGGVIGGTSAGASIQGGYLVRGNPEGNREVSAEGYERGFGFLPGVAIDQHFTQRKRMNDLIDLKTRHPELVALGIDESTAVIVTGSQMEVVGEHSVTIFDRPPVSADEDSSPMAAEPAVVKSGEIYDFARQKRLYLAEKSAASGELASKGDARAEGAPAAEVVAPRKTSAEE